MSPTPRTTVAFAASPLALARRACPFHGVGVAASRPRPLPAAHARRAARARVVALGAPPPSPPPEDPKEGDEPDASTPGDPASDPTAADAEGAGAAQAPGGTDGDELREVTADDILNSPSFLKKKLELVQKELLEVKSKADTDDDAVKEEKANYVRLAADFENYRRRSVEDLRAQDSKSTAKVCKEILNVLDNFERATKAVKPESERETKIVASYEAINRQLLDALIKLGVEPIDAIGETFDPEVHEAIQKLESDEYAEDVVCDQYQRGYKIGENLIRAAIVGVSCGPGPEGSAGDAGDTADTGDSDAPVEGATGAKQAADGL